MVIYKIYSGKKIVQMLSLSGLVASMQGLRHIRSHVLPKPYKVYFLYNITPYTVKMSDNFISDIRHVGRTFWILTAFHTRL